MKMLLVGIFALSCAQIAATPAPWLWDLWPDTVRPTTRRTTTEEPTTEPPEVHKACSDPVINTPGVYFIQPNRDVKPFEVYCDTVNGRKWTVIQQRFNKSVDFYRTYAEYTKGFGPLTGNHWLGLEKIHQLTKNGDHELMVLLQTHNAKSGYAKYSTFKVGSEATGFQLSISGYSGTAGDSMYDSEYTPNNGMKFTTFDMDQDMWPDINCAEVRRGAWWYNYGSRSELNGPYHDAPVQGFATMRWDNDFGLIALKSVRMMVRQK